MSLPGPGGPLWALGLVVFGAAVGVVGESIRQLLAGRVPLFATIDPFERSIIDLYLGGGALYLIASLPPGLFYPATFPVVVLVAVLGLWVGGIRRAGRPDRPGGIPPGLHLGWRSVAVVASLVLLGLEVLAAEGAPTGNTFDSALFTAYTALLTNHHVVPLNLAPVALQPLPYPQGSTVWFATGQLLFGLPPARTAVLLTPLFFGLVPIAGFVLGRRWFGGESGGAAVALVLALVASWTRVLVSGSNDFVLAFPLAVVLFAWLPGWWRAATPGWGSALGFGLLTGCLAALNPVAAQVVLGAVLVGRWVARPVAPGPWTEWAARWGGAVALTVGCVAPSLAVELLGNGATGVPGTGSAAAPYGVSTSALIGLVDPFLLRPSDVALSPFPWLRLELIVLLVVGLVWMLNERYATDAEESGPGADTAAFAVGAAATVGLLVEWLGGLGNPVAGSVARLSSPTELSILLFTAYGLVAAVPLAAVLRRIESSSPASSTLAKRSRWRWDRTPPETRAIAVAAALVVLAPAVAVTATSFPDYLTQEYGRFGNVTAADFALLAWAPGHLPAHARVLVAPGSAAQFLPGYVADVALVFPVTVFGVSTNADYDLLLAELPNDTLDARGVAAIDALGVGFIAVTGPNSVLWLAFDPQPVEAQPRASLVFHQGDAYLFQWAAP